MKINTKQHLSDKADSFVFIKKGTIWENDPKTNTLQDIYDDMHPYSANGYPIATTEKYGLIMLAKDDDLLEEGNNNVMYGKFLLENMDKPKATYNHYGLVKLSTIEDYDNGSDDSITTNKIIQYAKKTVIATNQNYGTVKFSVDEEILEGVRDDVAITPLQLKIGINTLHQPIGIATETVSGTVRITTPNDNYAGTINNGFALSPSSINKTRATNKKYGITKISTENAYINNLQEVSVTPLLIKKDVNLLYDNNKQITKIENDYNDFISNRPKLIKEIFDKEWGKFGVGSVLNQIFPIGNMSYSYYKSPNIFIVECDGRSLNKNTYPDLFSEIGYQYGGSGNNFNIPDTRGLFVKMYGKSSVINRHALGKYHESTNIRQFQDDKCGKHRHGGWNGSYGQTPYGHTKSHDWFGDEDGDWDNSWGYTNDGTNLGGDNSLDPNFLIGNETRPWNMPLILYMRIK